MKPHLEELERRDAPAGLLVLDPTPPDAAPWIELFHSRQARRQRWADFNRDGRVNAKDVLVVQERVAARVAELYQGQLAVVIDESDAWVERQRATGEPIFVAWVGGDPPDGPFFRGVTGQAALAGPGANNCGPAWVYAHAIFEAAIPGWRQRPARTRQLLVDWTASVVAHEVGHLLGLPHSSNGIMGPSLGGALTWGSDEWAEIVASLSGSQPTRPMPTFV